MMKYVIAGLCLFILSLTISWSSGDASTTSRYYPTPKPFPFIVVIKEELPPPPTPFVIHDVNYNNAQRLCLALNIYHEAKNQSSEGQIAVGIVTLNRVASKRYPNNICDVVKQAKTWKGNPIRNKCAFSWFCDGKSDKPKDIVAWLKARYLANVVLDEYHQADYDLTGGSLWYHANYVKPWWAEKFEQTIVIENHIFYRDL